MHCVFSTKGRQPWITPELKPRFYAYVAGIAKQNGMRLLCINGTQNHMHLLISLPSSMSLAKSLQLLKGVSSKWIHETFPEQKHFAWQEGYGAFSVSISGISETIRYIENQEEHHRRVSFEEEFVAFLKKHQIEYDERYVWG